MRGEFLRYVTLSVPFVFLGWRWFWYTFARGVKPSIAGNKLPAFPIAKELRYLGVDLASAAYGFLMIALLSESSYFALARDRLNEQADGLGNALPFWGFAVYMVGLAVTIVLRYIVVDFLYHRPIIREAAAFLCFVIGFLLYIQTGEWALPGLWSQWSNI